MKLKISKKHKKIIDNASKSNLKSPALRAEKPKQQQTEPNKNLRIKKKSKLSAITILLISICFCIFSFSCYKLGEMYFEYKIGAQEYETINNIAIIKPEKNEQVESPYLNIDFVALRELNKDLVGWIQIPDTNISYPMVKSYDNDFYLRRNYEGRSYLGGTIFLDYLCSSQFTNTNTIIYGHHMKDGTMFADLKRFMKENYFNEHREIYVYTDSSVLVYDIFSAYQTDISDLCYKFAFADDSDCKNWVNGVAAQSYFKSDVAVAGNDKVITLSTCTNVDKSDRYVVQAVLRETINTQA